MRPSSNGSPSPVTDPIRLLAADAAALLLLGGIAAFVPHRVTGFATAGLSGLAALLCLPPLFPSVAASRLELPVGPPGLTLHLALDPLSALFLLVVSFCGTAVAAFAAAHGAGAGEAGAATARHARSIPCCLAALSLVLLASDPVTLAIGLILLGAAMTRLDDAVNPLATLLSAFMLLFAVCLLTPHGFAPRFDAVRAAPIEAGRATAGAALAVAGGLSLVQGSAQSRCWAIEALTAGAIIPCAIYLMMRCVLDLPGATMQGWWGFILILAGGAASVTRGWQAARHIDLSGSAARLARRQAGLAVTGLGLTLIGQSADLPDAASLGLAATLLLMVSSATAGTLTVLAAHALGAGADTNRLARLGGLARTMPLASASLVAGLLALSALPPGSGFAALWLLFHSILLAPRTGGLIAQLPLALAAAALALSASLATAASVRLIGIVVLSRPRSARGSAALDVGRGRRLILLALGGTSMLVGALPGLPLKGLADPTVRALTGTGLEGRAGWATLSASTASPGYSAMPVLALLALTIGAAALIVRRLRKGTRVSGVWNDGLAPTQGLPFGDPAAQSVGAGFLPAALSARPPAASLTDMGGFVGRAPAVDLGHALPPRARPIRSGVNDAGPLGVWLRRLALRWWYPFKRLPSPVVGLWAILLAFGTLLLVVAFNDGGGALE